MEQVDVLAVVGTCAPERRRYAKRLAAMTRRTFVPARRLALAPDPIDEALAVAPWSDAPAGAVIEFPEYTEVAELIGTLATPDAPTRLTGVACLVDAAHLLDDLRQDSYTRHPAPPGEHPSMGRHAAHALLAVNQIEYASVIVLVNWATLPTVDLSTVMALVSHLSPRARLRLHRDAIDRWECDTVYTVGQERPGWVGLLNGDYDPHMTDLRVSAFHYENVRPLHPGRLKHLLDERIEAGEFGAVIRSAGFCRFATRPQIIARWDHVGQVISFDSLGRDDDLGDEDDLLALGQDLAFIGIDLDTDALKEALDAAALTDTELAAGARAWVRFPDPFPSWPVVADRTE
ncbi:Putative metal chaperone, involved in Zn homeostasis, GTPase of COG0523 family [Microbacterium esteraromaticum]|uniref:Putative metal chaperone, involved in Zn homeostasis, GTPase of COG0523 family n=1 Tax=Microbacterium esteraromaticum TaxID=57043 RepID=A0A1R4IFS9_9MICO|nr:GTP-binding protein [Microbacterium esteraromaticum]SJN18665.1 Putative metal chaperone, involved in Zn homeostasis, GTPase of COG0523 family [Microbacterium esteraromaticum]